MNYIYEIQLYLREVCLLLGNKMSQPRPWKVQQRGIELLRLMSVISTYPHGWQKNAAVTLAYLIPRYTGVLSARMCTHKK